MHTDMPFINAAARFVLLCAVSGVATLFIGMLVPRRFDMRRFPYKSYAFERDGKLYRRLGVPVWKSRMPDASRVISLMTRKSLKDDMSFEYMERLAQETCIAESTHWLLILLCPLYAFFVPVAYCIPFSVIYALGNAPFIMIQRYNRPRMLKLIEMRRERGENIKMRG